MSTADHLLEVLQIFTLEHSEWTVDAAAQQLGVSASTAYRYFSSLYNAGLLDTISSGKYVLGPAFIAYDRQIRMLDPVLRVARPVMQRLIALSNRQGVALLCRYYRQQVMCVHQEFGGEPDLAISYERGRPMGMFQGASSRVILAHLPTRTLKALHSSKREEISKVGLGQSWEDFKANLRKIRAAGVLVTRGQLDAGRIGIASPVFNPAKMVVGSISMVLREDTATNQFIANVSLLVQAAGREIDAGMAELAANGGPVHQNERRFAAR